MVRDNETLADGQGLRVSMVMIDSAAAGARDAAHQTYVDSLENGYRDGQAGVARGDAEAALSASIAAVEKSQQRLADRLSDADAARGEMIRHLSDAWRGAA